MNNLNHLTKVATVIIIVSAMTCPTYADTKDDSYETPRENFSVSELKNGYSLSQAQRLHGQWNLQKFLNITESGAYSYLNLPEFLPHTVIRRDGAVAHLETDISHQVGEIQLDHKGKSIRFETMITGPESPVQGVLVMNKGKIIYESYPGMRKTDRHVWMSNSKVFAGLLIAMLVEEGLIDVQKTVSHLCSGCKRNGMERYQGV